MEKYSDYNKLINDLILSGYLKDHNIIEVFRKINRQDFLRPQDTEDAALNEPLPIGYGQTISQPLTVAFMMELLAPQKGETILDVGSGSGWTAALLAGITGDKGKIYGIEIIKELKEFAEKNIAKYNFIKSGRVKIFHGDGHDGLPEYSPFDKIIIAAAATETPKKLLKQLKTGGRMVLPLGGQSASQDMVVIEKRGVNKFKEEKYPGFIFVPLVKNYETSD